MKNSNQIELLAVNAVEDFFAKIERINPMIPLADKEPSWDGFLYLYSDDSMKKQTGSPINNSLLKTESITCNKAENKPMPQMDNNEDIMEISEDDFPGIVVCRWNTTNGETSRFLFGSAIEFSDDFLDKYHNDVEESEK